MQRTFSTKVRNWDSLPVLLNMSTLSALLFVDSHSLNKLCRNGEMPGARKIGRFWYVEKNKLKNYFEEETA